MMEKGRVVKVTGSWYIVSTESGELVNSRIIGKFRLDGKKLTNPVTVGDEVMIEMEDLEESSGIIKKILPRRNYVTRQSPRKKHDLHLIATNVDQAMVMSTIVSPTLKPAFIDRFLLMTEPHDIPAIVLLNKSDLWGEEEMEMFWGLESIYSRIGYEVRKCSAITGDGMDEIRDMLKGKITLLGGQSGVGKSSVINALQEGLGLKTQIISDYSGKGQHTTTFAEMFELDNGGSIIDTPGIKTLSFNNLEVMDVAHNFREFFEASKECKFSDCTHRDEPGCAVKSAIEEGEISELRYMNYLQILDDIEGQNYWERRKDL
jgi:ribosome biogenesis GTPase